MDIDPRAIGRTVGRTGRAARSWLGLGPPPHYGLVFHDEIAVVAAATITPDGPTPRAVAAATLPEGAVVGGRVDRPDVLAATAGRLLRATGARSPAALAVSHPDAGAGLDETVRLLAGADVVVDHREPVAASVGRLAVLAGTTHPLDRAEPALRYVASFGWQDVTVDIERAGLSIRSRPRSTHLDDLRLHRGDTHTDPGAAVEPLFVPRRMRGCRRAAWLAVAAAVASGHRAPPPRLAGPPTDLPELAP